MPLGPGVYDEEATFVREETRADAVVVLVVNGVRGSGFSVQGPLNIHAVLPDLMEYMAGEIRKLNRQGEL